MKSTSIPNCNCLPNAKAEFYDLIVSVAVNGENS